MQVYEQPGYTTRCGTAKEWEELKKPWSDEESVSVLDLRSTTELKEELEGVREGWEHRRLPLTGSTVSEQDVDVYRREQRRHGKLIVVATNEARASLIALADIGRIKRVKLDEADTGKLDSIKEEKALLNWLQQYLERHRDTVEIGEY